LNQGRYYFTNPLHPESLQVASCLQNWGLTNKPVEKLQWLIMARTRNYLAGIGASTIFGFSFLFTKNALDHIAPHELIFLRFLTAALIMSVLVLWASSSWITGARTSEPCS
jgi:hypothetical protein